MIDHIAIKAPDRLELVEKTPEEAKKVRLRLEEITGEAKLEKWPIDYTVKMAGSCVFITGDIRSALANFSKAAILSESRALELVREINRLKKAQDNLKAPGFYAKKQLTSRGNSQKNVPKFEFSKEYKEIMDERKKLNETSNRLSKSSK